MDGSDDRETSGMVSDEKKSTKSGGILFNAHPILFLYVNFCRLVYRRAHNLPRSSTGAVWLAVAGVALVWGTDWKVIMTRIPYIRSRYPPPSSDED